jgi:hypothetical protein
MNKIQKAIAVFSIAAVSLFLPCAAAPMFGPAFPDVDDDGTGKAKTSKSSNTANKSAAAPASGAAAVAPPPAPVPVPPPPPPASVPAAPVIVDVDENEEYDEFEDFGDRPAPVVEAPAEPVEEPAAVDSALVENEKKVKKEKVKKEKVKKEKKEKAEKEVKPQKSPEDYVKPVKFGGRLAYHNSYVPALSVVVDEVDVANGGIKGSEYTNKPGLGSSGFEVGAAVEVRLAGPLSLYAGANVAVRKPVAIEGALTISEMALNVPVLFRVMVVRPVFFDIGGQLDVPFGTKSKWEWGVAEDFEGRTTIDGGGVFGIGGYIYRGLSIDAKGVVGLRNFAAEHEKPVYQVSVGISYMY